MPTPEHLLPRIKSVNLHQPFIWLGRGWRDMLNAGWMSWSLGLVIALAGSAITLLARHRFWMLAGSLSGFLVIAPVLATGLYALSRAMERGQHPGLNVLVRAWTMWQSGHEDKFGNGYWCMVQFGVLLALAATGWVITSAALITLLAPVPIETPLDFLQHVVLARDERLFTLWLATGGLMAAPIFASSVVAIPIMLDRRLSLPFAVLTSWQCVLVNPLPLALWATLIMLLTALGMGTLMLGLIPIIPILGHASWHAYRDMVDAESFEPLEPAANIG